MTLKVEKSIYKKTKKEGTNLPFLFFAKDYLNGAGMGVKKPKSNMPAAILCRYPAEEQERKESQPQYCLKTAFAELALFHQFCNECI